MLVIPATYPDRSGDIPELTVIGDELLAPVSGRVYDELVRNFGLVLGGVVCVVLLVFAVVVGDFTPGFNPRLWKWTGEWQDWDFVSRVPKRIFLAVLALGVVAWMLIRYG